MSYHRSHSALGVTRDQQKILIDIPAEELQKLPPDVRLNLVLRRQEVKAAERASFWEGLSTAVVVAAPLAAFFGFSWFERKKGKKQ
jgi:hypothetical protein